MDRDGTDALSIRNVATELGATPMALYTHVRDKDDLIDGLGDVIFSLAELPAISDNWKDQLRAAAVFYRDTLLEHPNAVPIIVRRPIRMTTFWSYIVNYALTTLVNAGFTLEDAVYAYRAMTTVATGQVLNQVTFELSAHGDESLDLPDGVPVLASAEGSFVRPDFNASFAFAFDVVLDGLEARLAKYGPARAVRPRNPSRRR